MKVLKILYTLAFTLFVSSCGNSVSDSDEYVDEVSEVSPLDTMSVRGPVRVSTSAAPLESGFIAGDTVEVAAVNTPLFVNYPKSGATPTTLLESGSVFQVLGTKGEYLQVSNGSLTGYVPDVMVVPQGVIDSMPPEELVVSEEDAEVTTADTDVESVDIEEVLASSEETEGELDEKIVEQVEVGASTE